MMRLDLDNRDVPPDGGFEPAAARDAFPAAYKSARL
jgi:hypothetical protein